MIKREHSWSPCGRPQGTGSTASAGSLVDEVVNWARLRKIRTLLLMVTGRNQPAIHFYERLGFTKTGRTEPYPNEPAVVEYEMSRPILWGVLNTISPEIRNGSLNFGCPLSSRNRF